MCGRYRRRSDKQRIADAFAVGAGHEEIYFEPLLPIPSSRSFSSTKMANARSNLCGGRFGFQRSSCSTFVLKTLC
jgi:hypothetical protein